MFLPLCKHICSMHYLGIAFFVRIILVLIVAAVLNTLQAYKRINVDCIRTEIRCINNLGKSYFKTALYGRKHVTSK
jgi:hypothetical protein